MPPVGFEPTISAGERPQTYALDRAATGTGIFWVCALDIQHAMRMRRIILPSVACPALHFSTLSHKRQDFREKKLLNVKCAFNFLHNFCLKHFSFYEQFRQILSQMYSGIHVNYQLLFSDFTAGVDSWGCWLSRRQPWTQASGKPGRFGGPCSMLHSPRGRTVKSLPSRWGLHVLPKRR